MWAQARTTVANRSARRTVMRLHSCRSTAAGGCRVGGARAHGQPQAGPAPDASDGLEGPVSTASNEPAGQGTQDLPLPAQGPVHRAHEPGLGNDISYTGQGVHVPGGDHGLVFSPGAVMAGLEHPGYTSVSRHWRKLYSALKRRRSSIPTKGPSSPVRRSPTCSRATPLRSAWMARADGWTTCSSTVA